MAIVVVSFAAPATLTRYQEQHHWPFPILADPDRHAYRAFALKRLSLLRVFSPATLKLYLRMRGERTRERYSREDIYQGGGDFLLDRAGHILFAHRSRDPADRPSVAQLLVQVDQHLPPRR